MEAIKLMIAGDCEPTIKELDEVSKKLDELRKSYPFIRDWDLIHHSPKDKKKHKTEETENGKRSCR
tara:strand:+ start:2170 stop:2367 length:198 start_codon:yes stop_codon:yes gene_type:complete